MQTEKCPTFVNKARTVSRSIMALLLLSLGLIIPVINLQAQPDYPPAIWKQAFKNHWYNTGNGHKFVVIHDMEGYYASTISYFQQRSTQASAHFCVNGLKDSASDFPAGEI